MDHSDKVKRNINPRERANIFSLVTFLYTRGLFISGFKKDLEDDDLYEVVRTCKSKKCGDKLEHAFKADEKKDNPSTFRILWKVYGLRYLALGGFHLTWRLVNSILEPEAVSQLVAYFKLGQTKMTLYDALYYAGIMIGLKLLHCFYFQNYIIYLNQLAIQIRSSFCSLIYRKALKLSPKALANISLGNIVTVITKDVLQFESAIWLFNDLWIAVVQIIVTCYLIYRRVGWSSTVGVIILFSCIPAQMLVGKAIKQMRLKINKRTDERLQKTQETLSTIRIIKMYTWEKIFGGKIDETRKKEMKAILKTFYGKAALMVSSLLVSKLAFYALIMTYIYINTDASAETIFYVMRCFGTLRHTISFSLAFGFTRIAELTASLSRINLILREDELPEPEVDKPDDEPQIEFKNVSVVLKKKEILKNINLKLQAGLTVVTGQLGCGKSSFVKVILKDYPIDSGELRTRGRKSYASQDAWLFPASIKQNIIFGEKYDYVRYQHVIKVCALEYDFTVLEKGDETIVADRGLNLSKGQQARVNLARAIYKDSDIYLIDDSLTALDPRVQEQIFEECIRGFLKGKLVLLVTHNTKHLRDADKLIVLDNGAVKFEGKQQEISKDILEAIEDVVETKVAKIEEDVDDTPEANEKSKLLKPVVRKRAVYHENKKEGGVGFDVYNSYFKFGGGFFFILLIFCMYFGATFCESSSHRMLTNWINQQQQLVTFREKYFPNVTFLHGKIDYTNTNLTTSSQYLANVTFPPPLLQTDNYTVNKNLPNRSFVAGVIPGGNYTLENVTRTSNNFTNDTLLELEKLELKSSKTLNFYSILMLLSAVLELIKHYLILKFAVNASVGIHKGMINSVIYAVMAFFDNFFIGNILNRFSQDLNVIDEHLPFVLSMLIGTMFHLTGVIGLISTVDWKFVIPSLVLVLTLVLMRVIYIPTSRSLKRLEAATRSPLVGHLNSTMEGMTTIRAFKAQEILTDEFDKHQDLYTSAYYTSMCAKRAFAFYMDFFAVSFIVYIISSFLFTDNHTAAGDVGLTINEVGAMAMIVQHGLMQWSETENLMTAVERVLEYTKLEPETTAGDEILTWPSKGEVNYVNVSLTYTNSHEKVLKGISFQVKSREKIGIVGRTGAGKSSIISTLFRLYNYDGDIFIDGVELKSLSLKYLREHISIIPQDPVMFSGTIRSNIDPFNRYTDEEIWKTLHKIHLDDIVPNLEENIEDCNFSTGQRQLICLARAIIKKNKIVVLDEATANMDPETESMIQKAIENNFHACTIFIIAHRLQSIMHCQKVMVLDKGEIVEYENPLVLTADNNSRFSQMLKNAGLGDEILEEKKTA